MEGGTGAHAEHAARAQPGLRPVCGRLDLDAARVRQGRGAGDQEQLAEWLRTTLKLTLSADKTAITHWSERVPFLGYEIRGIKSRATGAGRPPRLLIPQAAEARVRHTVARLTRQTFVQPGDMIDGVNRVLRGWMHYYAYAANPHRAFARVLHDAFWKLVRYVLLT